MWRSVKYPVYDDKHEAENVEKCRKVLLCAYLLIYGNLWYTNNKLSR